QLMKQVLAVGSWFSPINRTCWLSDLSSNQGNTFSIASHGQLLHIGRKSAEILLVRQYCDRLYTKEIDIPDGQQAYDHRNVALQGSSQEVRIHLMKAIQEVTKMLWSDGEHRR